MALNAAASNAAVQGITASVTHIGLTNTAGTEITGGSYARQAVTWAAAAAGAQKIAADETFDIPAGAQVGGWRGFTALTGGTNMDGGALTEENYGGAGQYVLESATTGYTIA